MTQQEMVLHKKRFGQYFSGKRVADMLFSLLPEKHEWVNVVDPIAGIGDMLVAVRENAKKCSAMFGVEIDEEVSRECAERVPEARVIHGDAFSTGDIVTPEGFDLVITNPPYVRYQLQGGNDEVMPSAQEIRENLIVQIGRTSYLSDEEKALFLQLAKNYSGLSDMAVPAWLLCAALVKKDGYLAMVVPETWLSRDYAAPIQYLLLKCFRVETVAIDTNASWFPEALVKTCLIVAKRTEMQSIGKSEQYITRIVETDRSIEQPTTTLFPHLRGVKDAQKWSMPEDVSFFSKNLRLPHDLAEIVGERNATEYVSLSDMGIECGQGLRTGANDFFYVQIKEEEGESVLVRSKAWDRGGRKYRFEKDDIVPTLQNRGEVNGLVVTPDKLKTAVIYPQGEIQGELRDYIDLAETYHDTKGRRFKDYSAVAPNEKIVEGKIVREWFRLPKMANRHLPNLCLTRVSARIPECLFVTQSETDPIAIDANMVTLWGRDTRTIRIAFAMLNSTWSKLYLELICTVMGGGALKVEASHLKKLLFPKLSNELLQELENAGKELIAGEMMTEDIQEKIDNTIAAAFGDEQMTSRIERLLERKYNERSTRL